jgi:hypothetical protein
MVSTLRGEVHGMNPPNQWMVPVVVSRNWNVGERYLTSSSIRIEPDFHPGQRCFTVML